MAFIRIKEIFPDSHSAEIKVDGVLDQDSLSILKEVCRRHLQEDRKVLLNLEGLIHISRESREFLREIRGKISGIKIPPLMGLDEISGAGAND